MPKAKTKPKGATSYKETAFGIIPRSEIVKLEIKGTKRGFEYIYKIIQREKFVTITPVIICQIHQIAFGWIFPKWAGKFRKIQVAYSSKEAPPHYQLPELMTNLCKDLEERLKHLPNKDDKVYILKIVELLAWFQHRFVFIHPFQDYNGRLARMLTTLILLTINLPPIEIKAETDLDRKRYLKAMQEGDEGNLTLLDTLINHALSESLLKIEATKDINS